ncbi:ABC transporter ATP-binding protein [Gammaproteobacteria bacterium]|nr:ABC transporter ATP-binding protein [Gammaproteobacteria bacterium]
MGEKALIEVDHVSKKFCKDLKKSLWYGIKDISSELVSRNRQEDELRSEEFWAVDDVSFKLNRGECLGLIGRNGAGKSTLLKIFNGLLKPDGGKITIRGRVAALIELGAGINPILTGRENIFVNGSVLGFSKTEIRQKMDEIIDFSEIHDFIDMPVQNYSTGMKVRLGFSIAAQMEPDVLLIDEVLAVGDVGFRSKCYQKIGQLIKHAAVIYVAQDMNQIGRICDQVLMLRDGAGVFLGSPARGIEIYLKDNTNLSQQSTGSCDVWEPGLTIHNVCVEPHRIHSGESVHVIVDYTAEYSSQIGSVRCNFVNQAELMVADYDSAIRCHDYELKSGRHVLRIPLGRLPLTRGHYKFNIAALDESKKVSLFHAVDLPGLEVNSKMITTSCIEMGEKKC